MPTLFPPDYPLRHDAPLLSFGPSFAEEIARSVIQAIWHENDEQPHETQTRSAAGLTMLEAFHPRDQLECMLAAEGVAVHCAIMENLRLAMLPEQSLPVAIKLRNSATGMYRMLSGIMRDLERRQSKPLPRRPDDGTDAPDSGGPPPGTQGSDDLDKDTVAAKPRAKRVRKDSSAAIAATPRGDAAPRPFACPPNFEDMSDVPEDIETRPDGTPACLAAYAPKVVMPVVIPREALIMVALATRPKPYRMVNAPGKPGPAETEDIPSSVPDGIAQTIPDVERRGPLELTEDMFTGDALARFASARFDPNAPVEPFRFKDDAAVVELELISTGGHPEAEADRAAMIAAHPDGKPIMTLRYGTEMADDAPPDKPPDDG